MLSNREYLINQLSNHDFIDDGGASYEATIFYNISCPYSYGDERSLCFKRECGITRKMCFECKEKWLNGECEV